MYDMMPPQPTQFVPRPVKKRLSVPQIMLIVVTLGFLVWYLITALIPAKPATAQISLNTYGTHYSGECLIIRDESPYDADSVTSVDYKAEEGASVQAGELICNAYAAGYSDKARIELQDYRDKIKEYQLKLLSAEVATDAQIEKLENEVLTRAREVRKIIHGARGNINNQEKLLNAAIESRQSYLRDKYANDQRMTRLFEDEKTQRDQIEGWKHPMTASRAGIVSFYSDGFEYIKDFFYIYDQFSISDVKDMLKGNKPESAKKDKGKTTVFRLVQDGSWRVLMLISDCNWNPTEGGMYELRLENFKDTTVRAQVVGFTRSGKDLLVRMTVDAPVGSVLYVRSCSAVIGDNTSVLTVPAEAIYSQKDENNILRDGVVRVEGDYEWFEPVYVVDERDDVCYIVPLHQDALYEGQEVKMFY